MITISKDILYLDLLCMNSVSLRRTAFLLVLFDLFTKEILHLVGPPWSHIRVEYMIDLLERPAGSFGVHEEHVASHHRAEDAEDDVGFPLDIGKGGCDKVSEREVEDPVRGRGDANAFSPVLQGENFRAVDPCCRGLCSISVCLMCLEATYPGQAIKADENI